MRLHWPSTLSTGVLLLPLSLGVACTSDGGEGDTDAASSTGAATEPASTTMSASPASSSTDPGSTTSSGAEDASTSSGTSAGSASSEGETSGGIEAWSCPPGPYASNPLPGDNLSATALPGTSTSVGSSGLVEGPIWWNGALYLSHFWGSADGTVMRYEGGALEVLLDAAGTNGLAHDVDGQLLAADHLNGAIAALDLEAGTRTFVIETFEGARFNSPNDLTVRDDGNLYFTDPTYQAPQPQPQPVAGVYRVDPSGGVELFETGLSQPNGISLAPDQGALYVGDNGGLTRYALEADGSVVTPGAAFGTDVAGVDGMAVDCAGNVYATFHGVGIVAVFSPDGERLGDIAVAPQVTNVAFGGEDRTTLFITAGNPDNGDAIYSVELLVPGFPY